MKSISVTLTDHDVYCPICERVIEPLQIKDPITGEHQRSIFIHDDVPHSSDDIEALHNGRH